MNVVFDSMYCKIIENSTGNVYILMTANRKIMFTLFFLRIILVGIRFFLTKKTESLEHFKISPN